MDYQNKEDGYYNNPRPEMLDLLPLNSKTILDVGCADGTFSKSAKDKSNAEVWGIEFMPNEAEKATKLLDKVIVGKIEDSISKLPENYFDVIYFNDVLEHLVDPDKVLHDLKRYLTSNGVIISSIPNIRYHKPLMNLIFKKDWKYEDHGVLDKTHLRFFTKTSIERMYVNAGYQIVSNKGINKSKSLKPWIYNLFFLFSALDMRNLQYATIAKVNK
jgi:2-polyprenyl-3-methyl-5-hydroxy-6-metoxy-1,4-benzoquinol methylase